MRCEYKAADDRQRSTMRRSHRTVVACFRCDSTSYFMKGKASDRIKGMALASTFFGLPVGMKYLVGKHRYCADCGYHEFYHKEV